MVERDKKHAESQLKTIQNWFSVNHVLKIVFGHLVYPVTNRYIYGEGIWVEDKFSFFRSLWC